MAVLGHSMGGLITHMLVRNGHGALWRATFTVRPGDLHFDESRRAELSDIFSVRHEPQIQFVAFIGTLHRGNETADSPIGYIGSSLVDLPLKFTSFFLKDQAYLERATDGVVTYDSARFSPQEDEQIVQAGHDVQRHPQAVSYLLDRLRNWKP